MIIPNIDASHRKENLTELMTYELVYMTAENNILQQMNNCQLLVRLFIDNKKIMNYFLHLNYISSKTPVLNRLLANIQKNKKKYKCVISTAPLTPTVTSGALTTVSSHKRLQKEKI